MSGFLAAVCQLTTTDDRVANLRTARELVRRAAGRGAELVCLPEMWPFIGSDADRLAGAESLDGPSVSAMQELASELGIWLFPGSFAERADKPGYVWNTSPVIGPDGALVAAYRKIHLFDVGIPGVAEFRESDAVASGDEAVVVDTALARVGLTICYDLRFPLLYKTLRDAGADLILVPSAFIAHTGKDHWEVLLRARAIEQQVWVLGAEQTGRHNRRRESHGHSMIVDPWGHVVARVGDGAGVAVAEVDLARSATVRRNLPCSQHRRAFSLRDLP